MPPTIDSHVVADRTLLAGKRVLVTGGASGLGEAYVRMYASAHAYVVIADINSVLGEKLERDLGGSENRVKFISVNVSSWSSQASMFKDALQFTPGQQFDIVVASAGTGSQSWDMSPTSPIGPNEAMIDSLESPAPRTTCFEVGLIGSYYTTLLATKYGMGLHESLRDADNSTDKNDSKCIILMGSTAGYRSLASRIDYTANKWGTRGLFISLRTELARFGLRVNMVAPYFIPTPLTQASIPALKKQGVEPGSIDVVTEVIAQLSINNRINGRSIGVTSEGMIDLCDDLDGTCEGVVFSDLMQRKIIPPLAGKRT